MAKIGDLIVKRKDLLLGVSALVLLIVIGSTSFVTESLWLDEGISYWITAGSFNDVVHRAVTYQGQSPLYYAVLWAVRQSGFESEFLLRLPSIGALALSALVFLSLARRFVSKEASIVATLLFLATSPVLRAMSARPYALALLFALLSWWGFFHWLETRKGRGAVLYVVSLVLAFYAHYLFLLSALLPLLWYFSMVDKEKRKLGTFFVASITTVILILPGFFQIYALHARRESLFFSPDPTFLTLGSALCPLSVVIAVVGGILIARIFISDFKLNRSSQLSSSGVLTLLLSYLIPPLLFFGYSYLGSGSLFNERYFFWSLAPLCILIAWCFDSIAPFKAKCVTLVITCLFLIYAESSRTWHLERWREASAIVKDYSFSKEIPVLLSSGLVESSNLDWIKGEETSAYLSAPFAPYPLYQKPSLLPARVRDEAEGAYVRDTLRKALEQTGKAVFVYLSPLSPSTKRELETSSMEIGVSRETLQKGVVTVEVLTVEKK